MTCIVCGTAAEYVCSINTLGVGLCEEHMETIACTEAVEYSPF